MRRPSHCWTTLLAAMSLLAALGAARAEKPLEKTSSPVLLQPAVDAASALPRLHSLLVSQRGSLILERYFHGASAARLANIKSASKSVLSALVGIAIERRLLAGVEAPIAPFFPDLLGASADPRKRRITIEDLLTMRSGQNFR